ncbi:1816_t:CDS:1, partial [Funneliformis geosporum]
QAGIQWIRSKESILARTLTTDGNGWGIASEWLPYLSEISVLRSLEVRYGSHTLPPQGVVEIPIKLLSTSRTIQ